MSSFENFVQCRVVTPFTAAATEIGLFAADTPHRLPAEGGGVLVLTDSPYRPSALEVIRYGRRSGLALYDVSRAQEGTAARDWTGVAFCYQALTAGELAQLLGQKADLSALDGLREEAETALNSKVDKVAGKGLSANDYTTAEKNKLANANLTALTGLTGAADRLPYFTGAGALSLATLTAAARTLLAATNVTGQQSALGLFADASGVVTNASGALTNFVSQLLRSADAEAGRNTLGLGTAATLNAVANSSDGTPGRVLTTASHGVGATSENVPPLLADFKAENPAGLYRGTTAGTANNPVGASPAQGFTAVCMAYSRDRLYFVIFPTLGVYFGWYAQPSNSITWRELFYNGNQLSLGTTAGSARTTMGLGTAATLDVTASHYDTTNGRLLKTRDFSVGLPAGVPAQMLSTFGAGSGLPTGAFYRAFGAGTGAPTPGAPAGSTGNQMCVLSLPAFGDDVWRHWLASENSGSAAARRLWWGQTHPSGIFWDQILTTSNASILPITGSLSPSGDNIPPLGEAAKRWSTAYLGTAPIVTSDREAKQDTLPIDDAVLDAWATLNYMQYRLKDAVAAKGEAARTHAGLIAQDIREAFESAGLNPFKYGVLCYDEWEQELLEHPAEYEWITVPAVLDDEGNEVEPERQEQGGLIKEAWTEVVREAGHRYSVRYEEAFALECALQRRTTERLEQRLAALESAA